MIKLITRRIYRKGLTALERGDLDSLLAAFDDRCTLTFVGDTSLGAKLSTPAGIRRWFERFGRLLPNATFHIEQTVINGPLWNQRLAAHVTIRSTIDGEPYDNQFAHLLRLRWGKVVDDLIIEDSQRWERACQRLVAAGVSEAGEPPVTDDRSTTAVGPKQTARESFATE